MKPEIIVEPKSYVDLEFYWYFVIGEARLGWSNNKWCDVKKDFGIPVYSKEYTLASRLSNRR